MLKVLCRVAVPVWRGEGLEADHHQSEGRVTAVASKGRVSGGERSNKTPDPTDRSRDSSSLRRPENAVNHSSSSKSPFWDARSDTLFMLHTT